MHEELDRPLRADGAEGPCNCRCKKTTQEGEEQAPEGTYQSNYLAVLNDIGG